MSFDGLELIVEVSDEGIRLIGDQSDVVGAARVLFVRNEKRHIFESRRFQLRNLQRNRSTMRMKERLK